MFTRFSNPLSLILVVVTLALVSSCGGGGDLSTTPTSSAADFSDKTSKALAVGQSTDPAIRVTGLIKLSERRLARTTWEYVFRVDVANSGIAAQGVRLTLTGVPAGSTIVDGSVVVGDIAAAGTASPLLDTITIQQDRLVALDLTKFTWLVKRAAPSGSGSVSIDPGIAPATLGAISRLITPLGSGDVGGVVPLPTMTANAESMVLAVDSAGDIRLAALARSQAVTLSADSTAIALVRLLLGPFPPGGVGAAGDAAIRSTADFATLQSTLASALAAGVSPSRSQAVVNALSVVASQSVASFVSTSTSGTTSRSGALAVASPRLTRFGFPYTLLNWPSFPAPMPVLIAKGTGVQLDLVNGMTIAWAVQATDVDGAPMGNEVVLAPNDLLAVLSGLVKPENSSEIVHTTVAVPGTGAFSLKLFQTKGSIIDTGASIASRILSTTLSFAGAKSCDVAHLKINFALAFNLIYNRNDSPAETLGKFLSVESLTELVASCAPNLVDSPKLFLRSVKIFYDAMKPVDVAVSTYLITSQIALAIQFYNEERMVGVCRAGGVIVNCASRFTFDPASVVVMPGIVISPSGLEALDASGMQTPTPDGLIYSAESVGATLDDPNVQGGTLAKLPGPGALVVTDPATGATGRLEVSVVRPAISPANSTIKVGDFLDLRLVDSSGRTLTPVPGSSWTASNPTVLSSDGTGGFLALSTGPTIVTYRNSYNGEFVTANVQVDSAGLGVSNVKGTCGIMGAGSRFPYNYRVSITGVVNGAGFGDFLSVTAPSGVTCFSCVQPIDKSCGGWSGSDNNAQGDQQLVCSLDKASQPAATSFRLNFIASTLINFDGLPLGQPSGQPAHIYYRNPLTAVVTTIDLPLICH